MTGRFSFFSISESTGTIQNIFDRATATGNNGQMQSRRRKNVISVVAFGSWERKYSLYAPPHRRTRCTWRQWSKKHASQPHWAVSTHCLGAVLSAVAMTYRKNCFVRLIMTDTIFTPSPVAATVPRICAVHSNGEWRNRRTRRENACLDLCSYTTSAFANINWR